MTRVHSPGGRFRLVLLALLEAVGVVAVPHSTATSAADTPTLTGNFCTFNGSMFCMTLTWNAVAYGTPNRAALRLQPGTYALTVNDTAAAHDFALRRCPDSALTCDSNNPFGTAAEITTRAQVGSVTTSVALTPGTYRLYCDVSNHETLGMFVDFTVEAPPVATSSLGGGSASVAHGGSLAPAPTISASDPDTAGSGLTATATGLPAGLSLAVSETSEASTLPGTRTWTLAGSASASPGMYPVSVAVSDADGNVGTTSLTIAVTPAPLTVTADHRSRLFGAPNPPLTATLAGFVLGQDAATSDVTGSASCTTTAAAFSPPGDYPIACAVGALSSPNYSFGPFVANTLTVTSTTPCLSGTRNGPLTASRPATPCAPSPA